MATKPQPTIMTRSVDLDLTPDAVFSNLHRMPGFFFLDSAKADHELSRYSYFGVNPFLVLRSRGEGLDVVEGKKIEHRQGNPLDLVNAELERLRISGGSLIPFFGGGVGYFGYELGRFTAEVDLKAPDDLGLPEMVLSFYKTVLAYEHKTKRWIAAAVDLSGGRGTTFRKRLGNEIEKLRDLATKPHRGTPTVATASPEEAPPEENGDLVPPEASGHTTIIDGVEVSSSLSRDEYLAAVRRIQEHISAGDIYQANLTQRWSIPFSGDPGKLYDALRKVSPAPYGAYMNTGECIVASSSPESFLSVNGRQVETRPIKGTRTRGATPEEDERLRRELLESSKDRAELVMIADLERNDLGKICEAGSVKVEELCRVESFSNVHHLVSVVRGELHPGTSFRDLLTAMFPSGSITGAPKKRAMEILDEVEGTGRGPYAGAMGFVGFDGTVSLNVAIRTLVLSQSVCHLGVGSGIVADSRPESEYEECVAKAQGMLAALRESRDEASVSSS